jgi:hypothetical protein
VIDVAHSGEDREDAAKKVIKGIEISLSNNHKGLKVIHGRGSKSGSGIIKDHIIKLLRREAKRLNAKLVMDKGNPGAHILLFWLMLSGGLEVKMYTGYIESKLEKQNLRCWQVILILLSAQS